MKVLVTGANGYIGRHVVKALLDKGADVIACDIVLLDLAADLVHLVHKNKDLRHDLIQLRRDHLSDLELG